MLFINGNVGCKSSKTGCARYYTERIGRLYGIGCNVRGHRLLDSKNKGKLTLTRH